MIIATILWGATYPLMKVSMQELSPGAFVFLRFFIAAAASLPILFFYRQKLNKSLFISSAIVGLCSGAAVFLQSAGIKDIPASLSAFLSGCAIIFVVIIRSIITQKKPSTVDVCTSIICIVGLGLVTGGGSCTWGIGFFYTILSSLFIAFHILFMDKYAKGGNAVIITLVEFIFCTLYAVGSSREVYYKIGSLSGNVWFAVLFCAIACSVVAFSLQAYSQIFLDPTRVAMIFMLEPVFATIMSYFFIGEDIINLQFLIGAFMILGSITYLSFRLKNYDA